MSKIWTRTKRLEVAIREGVYMEVGREDMKGEERGDREGWWQI